MKINMLLVYVGCASFLAGSLAISVAHRFSDEALSDARYQAGQLFACQQITSTINAEFGIGILCIIENKEVIISNPAEGLRYSLDGKKLN